MPPLKLTFVFHSCFIIETQSVAVIFDFFRDVQDFVRHFVDTTNKNVYFVNSHAHPDHFGKTIFALSEGKANTKIILSRDIKSILNVEQQSLVHHFIKLNEEYQDNNIRIVACPSTDIGLSFAIEMEGITAYHAGDNNNWYITGEMGHEELQTMEKRYLESVQKIKQKFQRFDIAMLPIDPRLEDEKYRGVRQFLDNILTTYLAPMHLWEQYELPSKAVSDLADYPCEVLVNDIKCKTLINTLP